MAGTRGFTLFALPRELRDLIYLHAVIEPSSCSDVARPGVIGHRARKAIDLSSAPLPPICLVSHQTAAESLPIYFKNNKLALQADHTGSIDLLAQHALLLRNLGPAVRFHRIELYMDLLPPLDSRYTDPAVSRYYERHVEAYNDFGDCGILHMLKYRPPLTSIAASGLLANGTVVAQRSAHRTRWRGWTLRDIQEIAKAYAEGAKWLSAT